MLSPSTLTALCVVMVRVSSFVIPAGQLPMSTYEIEVVGSDEVDQCSSMMQDNETEPDELLEYGVGIGLSTSYATVSVAYSNGTTVDLAKIEAGRAYKEMIERLSLGSSKHLTPPYVSIAESRQDSSRTLERQRRKSEDLPATRDVMILADLLQAARETAELYLWEPVETVTISAPKIAGLYAEDIKDALDFVGLNEYNVNGQPQPLLHESAATIINSGFGICSDLTDVEECLYNARSFPERTAMFISYTYEAISTEILALNAAVDFWPVPTAVAPMLKHDSGSSALRTDPSGEFYWSNVQDLLTTTIMKALMSRRIPTQIFLSGDSASVTKFRDVVERVSRKLIGVVPDIFVEDSLFAASRGAAYVDLRGGINAFLN